VAPGASVAAPTLATAMARSRNHDEPKAPDSGHDGGRPDGVQKTRAGSKTGGKGDLIPPTP
jgi:hypothetical protein